MKSIVLTGGGTAGHCLPHFALIKDLKKHFDNVYYIGSDNGIEKTIVKSKNIPYYALPTVKLKRSLTVKNLCVPFKLLKSIKQAEIILKKLKPDVIFSKGGYVGLPVTIAGNRLKIPVIVHESDRSLGLSNKIASRFSKKVLTTFEETSARLQNGEYVGAIINQDLFSIDKASLIKKYEFFKDKPTLLITGGSQGARAINQAVFISVNKLLKNFNVLHITGKGNLPAFSKKGYKAVEFIDMKNAYAVADLCVSRAGSNTLFELLSLKIPSLFIPLPKDESRGDQIENAEYFFKKGLCHILYQSEIENFYNSVLTLNENRRKLKDNLNNFPAIIGNQKIVKILTSV